LFCGLGDIFIFDTYTYGTSGINCRFTIWIRVESCHHCHLCLRYRYKYPCQINFLFVLSRLARYKETLCIFISMNPGTWDLTLLRQKRQKKFVITLLVCDDLNADRQTKKAVRRTLRKLNRRKRKSRRIEELKGTGATLVVKQYFYRQLKPDGLHIYTLVLNKERVWPELQTKKAKPRLYNYLARQLIDKLPLRMAFTNVRLVVDRSKNIQEIQDFNRYVRNQIEALLPLNTGFAIEHLTSRESTGLQAVDMFCWGIFRKYEFGDCDWYDIYSNRIRYETEYLPEKY
jgi:hypothetical protein